MKKISREPKVSDFELDAYIFWERARALARMGLEETGGLPSGKTGALFDLLAGACEAFEAKLRKEVDGELRRKR